MHRTVHTLTNAAGQTVHSKYTGPLGLASMSGARKTGWGGVSHQGIDTALFCRSNTFKCTLAQPGHTERCFPFESNQFEFYECSYITRRMKFYTRIKQIKNVDLLYRNNRSKLGFYLTLTSLRMQSQRKFVYIVNFIEI